MDVGLPGLYRTLVAPSAYYEYQQAIVEGGYPAARQLTEIIAGIHRCPVLRQRGVIFSSGDGDFLVTVGGDLDVVYRIHDREGLRLRRSSWTGAGFASPERNGGGAGKGRLRQTTMLRRSLRGCSDATPSAVE